MQSVASKLCMDALSGEVHKAFIIVLGCIVLEHPTPASILQRRCQRSRVDLER